ncbi:alpha/beta fold hydrolase [Pseudohoeflea coraliihabitans]|uniref:Alpha/beta hydrolase n=1 Tax=Pseudohoeflea coraliihabitans TaxID=2860393 RepID=A0ABS6WRY1_9HYPH|nr:alpha/beta hydrolase [Pseudohoeflea sp. DP4N28-3]MBW3097830.1 alpha/beta hydrolase [Pseudohoeflea sp. DP4N28-3]
MPAARAEDVWYQSSDGLRLYARNYGTSEPSEASRLPLICLPGLTRNHRDFARLAAMIAADDSIARRVIAFDYRGRGRSARADPATYTIAQETEDLLTGLAALGIDRAIFLGTSRGGLILHALAATHAELIAAAILNDIGPVIETAGLAQIKAYLAAADASTAPGDWNAAATRQRAVHAKAFPALGAADWRHFAECVYVEGKDGTLRPDYDPRLLEPLRTMNFDAPLPTLWPQFDALAEGRKLLILRGENSTLLSEETVSEMLQRAPGGESYTAIGQGHAPFLHLGGVGERVMDFLRAIDASNAT